MFFSGVDPIYWTWATFFVWKNIILKLINVVNLKIFNKNCQLKNNKSIFIVDGSVLNFKKNLYPLGFVMANAKRIAKLFQKKWKYLELTYI